MIRPQPFRLAQTRHSHEAFTAAYAQLHEARVRVKDDAADAEQARLAIERAIQYHDELGYLFSHELRNAATAVKITAQSLARRATQPEPGIAERLPVVLHRIEAVADTLAAKAEALERATCISDIERHPDHDGAPRE